MQAHGQPLKTLSREIHPIQECKNAFLYLRSEENSWYSCHYCGSKNTAGMVILSSFWASTLAVHPFALHNTNPWNCLPQMSTTNVETKVMETLEVLNSYPHLFALPNDCRRSSALYTCDLTHQECDVFAIWSQIWDKYSSYHTYILSMTHMQLKQNLASHYTLNSQKPQSYLYPNTSSKSIRKWSRNFV